MSSQQTQQAPMTPTKQLQHPQPQAPRKVFLRTSGGIGLTYSNMEKQLGRRITKDELFQFLVRPSFPPTHVVIGEEEHKDGAQHFHCYLQWIGSNPPFTTSRFDYNGHVHPNIQVIRNQEDWLQYIVKEDPSPLEWVRIYNLEFDYTGDFNQSDQE